MSEPAAAGHRIAPPNEDPRRDGKAGPRRCLVGRRTADQIAGARRTHTDPLARTCRPRSSPRASAWT